VTGGLRDRLAGETVIAGGIEEAFHDGDRLHFAPPAAVYTPAIAPSGATFVSLPDSESSDDLLVGALVGEQIRRLRFDFSGHWIFAESSAHTRATAGWG
jgi:hypothetical protein